MKSSDCFLKITFLSFVFFLFSLNTRAQTHPYLEKYKPLAQRLSSKYEIPASLILAIAFVETGGGTSRNAKRLHNHFGIMGKNKIHSNYRYFSSVSKSYVGFCELIGSKDCYRGLKGEKDVSKWLNAIAPTYTMHPSVWKDRVNFIINKYNLSDL